MKDLAVYIPVYNDAAYLPAVIQALSGLDPNRTEIVAVNDGSTDNTPRLLDEWAAKSPHVRVIHQRNMGRSGARNTALEAVTGRYVWACDGDDKPLVAGAMKALDLALSKNLDALFCRFAYGGIAGDVPQPFDSAGSPLARVWNKWDVLMPAALLRRDVIAANNLRFDRSLERSEDVDFVWRFLAHCKEGKVEAYDILIYDVFVREDSVSQKPKLADEIFVLDHRIKRGREFMQQGLITEEEFRDRLQSWTRNVMRVARHNRQPAAALAIHHRMKAICGADKRMKREYWRCLPWGWFSMWKG